VNPLRELLVSIGLPFLVAAVLSRALTSLWRPDAGLKSNPVEPAVADSPEPHPHRCSWASVHWIVALALCSFLLAQEFRAEWVLAGETRSAADVLVRAARRMWSPSESRHWLPWFALIAAGISSVWTVQPGRRSPATLLWLAFACAIPVRLLWGSIYLTKQWTVAHAVLLLGGWGLLAALAGLQSGGPNRIVGSRRVLFVLPIVWWTVAASLLLSASIVLAEVAAALGSAFVGILIGWSGRWRLPVPDLAIATCAVSLLLLGTYYAKLPGPVAGLLAAANYSALLPFLARPESIRLSAARMAIPLGLCLIALLWLGYLEWAAQAAAADNPYSQL